MPAVTLFFLQSYLKASACAVPLACNYRLSSISGLALAESDRVRAEDGRKQDGCPRMIGLDDARLNLCPVGEDMNTTFQHDKSNIFGWVKAAPRLYLLLPIHIGKTIAIRLWLHLP